MTKEIHLDHDQHRRNPHWLFAARAAAGDKRHAFGTKRLKQLKSVLTQSLITLAATGRPVNFGNQGVIITDL